MSKNDMVMGEPVALPARMVHADTREYDAPVEIHNATVAGWNACLDEIAKLGPLYTRPAPADSGEVERRLEEQRREFSHAQTVEHRKWAELVDDLKAQLAERDALFGEYGETLRPFVELMRKELEANSHKGDRNGWLQMDQQKAVDEINHHVGKLHGAMGHLDVEAVQEHAADIANCCMMFLDVMGLLAISASADPSAPVERDERAAFEKEFPVPYFVKWDKNENEYADGRSFDEGRGSYQAAWEGWQARAALERKP